MVIRKKSFRILPFLLLTALLPSLAWGGTVSEAEARQKARAFLRERNMTDADILPVVGHGCRAKVAGHDMADERNSYYVFNLDGGSGYVIVSGDDRTVPILGYSDSGSVSEDDMPDGLRYLLDGYAEQLEWMDSHYGADGAYETDGAKGAYKAYKAQSAARSAIAPMIETRWNQGAPYNNLCIEIDGEKTVTGCVATTLTQLMYFHKWPEPEDYCTNILEYTYTATRKDGTTTEERTVGGLPATTFDWNAMSLTYTSDATGTAANEVANLMQYGGRALHMMCGLSSNGGSSAYSEAIPYALKNCFGYDGGVRHTYRKNYSYTEWVELIYGELAEGRPVALGGQSLGGGHSFICDGYDTDDYFHINWGWGGSSDGYYRLSVLQPWEQGIGGSSTLDGFSYGQDAVIGIQPPVSGTKDYCLSLEGLRLGSSDGALATQTFSRDAETDSFTGISIYFLVYSYYQGSNYFDYAVQMVDGSGRVVKTFFTNEGQLLGWNGTNPKTERTITGLSIPSTVADGTYYIKVVSRPHGYPDWQECFDGDRYQMTAVISGDVLTINVPIPSVTRPSAVTFVVNGDSNDEGYLTQGYEQEVTASITGGAVDYHGDVILRVNDKSVMGKVLDIPARQTVDARFSFIPTETGDVTLKLYDRKSNGNQIGSTATITIKESTAIDNIDFTHEVTIDNLSTDGKLYGNALRATITLGNTSTTNSYAGKMNCSLRKWNITTTDNGNGTATISASWTSVDYKTYPLVVGKNSTKSMEIAFDGLETTDANTRYSVRISYQNSSGEDNVKDLVQLGLDNHNFGSLEVTNGYSLGDATGTPTIHQPSTSINVGNACYADLRSLGSLSNVTFTKSTNPNCVYLIADATIPDDLSGCNVVLGTSASNITLVEGHDFYTPIGFTADKVTYTRTFTRKATEDGGWNTMMLPFTVTKVTVADGSADGKEVDWFHSDSDKNKDFWLKTITSDDNGTVFFDHADELKANTPYIIALPGEDFGEKQLTGKIMTFEADGTEFVPTKKGTLAGNSFKFCGSTTGVTLKDVYMLNTKGNKFVKATSDTSLPAFRAWIEAVSISSLTMPSLSLAAGEINGIDETKVSCQDSSAVYNLSGQKVTDGKLKRGIYIRNGKKTVIR